MSDGALAEATVRDPGIRVLDLFRMEGSVAIVTGASSGLGVVFADALAEAGADVVLAARRTDRLEATRNRIQRHGRRCLAIPTDVTREDDCVVLVDRVTAELGAVDVLVNNAGVGYMSPAHREAPGQFRAAVETNLIGAHTMAQAVGRRLIEGERPGSIVNVASIIGLSAGDVPQAGYAASKAGVIGLTR
ncbi:MAG: SDR family NAD(P)-dependent oxidoreductase, partial [Candidatus Dormibacteria bacterium]